MSMKDLTIEQLKAARRRSKERAEQFNRLTDQPEPSSRMKKMLRRFVRNFQAQRKCTLKEKDLHKLLSAKLIARVPETTQVALTQAGHDLLRKNPAKFQHESVTEEV